MILLKPNSFFKQNDILLNLKLNKVFDNDPDWLPDKVTQKSLNKSLIKISQKFEV